MTMKHLQITDSKNAKFSSWQLIYIHMCIYFWNRKAKKTSGKRLCRANHWMYNMAMALALANGYGVGHDFDLGLFSCRPAARLHPAGLVRRPGRLFSFLFFLFLFLYVDQVGSSAWFFFLFMFPLYSRTSTRYCFSASIFILVPVPILTLVCQPGRGDGDLLWRRLSCMLPGWQKWKHKMAIWDDIK